MVVIIFAAAEFFNDVTLDRTPEEGTAYEFDAPMGNICVIPSLFILVWGLVCIILLDRAQGGTHQVLQ